MMVGVTILLAMVLISLLGVIWMLWRNGNLPRQTSGNSEPLRPPSDETEFPMRREFLEQLIYRIQGVSDLQLQGREADSLRGLVDQGNNNPWDETLKQLPLPLEEVLTRELESARQEVLRLQNISSARTEESYQEEQMESDLGYDETGPLG